jgi:hypothetical protein
MTDPRQSRSATTSEPVGGAARGVRVAYRLALLVFLVMGVVQIYLAGLGAFSKNEHPGFGPHRGLGFAMAGVALVILVLALLSRAGGRAVGVSVVILLLAGLGQSALAALGENNAYVGGLHAFDGLVILGLAGFLQGTAVRGSATGGSGRP